MPVFLKGNYIFTTPGKKAFLVSSNYTNYLELGQRSFTEYYLEAEIKDGRFVVSGILLDSYGKKVCILNENHLEEAGSCQISYFPKGGFRVTIEGKTVLELVLKDDNTCIIQGKFYDKDGKLVAEGNGSYFLIYHGPAVVGKSGTSKGIVIQ